MPRSSDGALYHARAEAETTLRQMAIGSDNPYLFTPDEGIGGGTRIKGLPTISGYLQMHSGASLSQQSLTGIS